MQKAGKGPRMETGAGIPKELMSGPAMHEPGHDGPVPINQKNPGQNVKHQGDYNAIHPSGPDPRPAPTVIGPTPMINKDTGDEYTYTFNSASIAGKSLDELGMRNQQNITGKSQEKSIKNVEKPNPLPQRTHAIGKRVYKADGSLVTDVSHMGYITQRARNAGQDPKNINQNELFNTVSNNLSSDGTSLTPGNRVIASNDLINNLYDIHKQDSTGRADFNQIKPLNDRFAANRPRLNKALDVQSGVNYSNTPKKK